MRGNFIIDQTPFSAQLSLKKSFAKHVQENGEEVTEIDEQTKMENVKIEDLATRLREVYMENRRLKETVQKKEDLILDLETNLIPLFHHQ